MVKGFCALGKIRLKEMKELNKLSFLENKIVDFIVFLELHRMCNKMKRWMLKLTEVEVSEKRFDSSFKELQKITIYAALMNLPTKIMIFGFIAIEYDKRLKTPV